MFDEVIRFIKNIYPNRNFIPLHEPHFTQTEKDYVVDCIDSTFVSSVGKYVDKFEQMMCEITGSNYAIAIVNGTCALHMALLLVDVNNNDEVITQPLTFIATCNAISYIGARPVFVDIEKDTLGMSPSSLLDFLNKNAEIRKDGFTYNIKTGKRIKACIPMHTFGLPCRIDMLLDICNKYNISLIEDAAESIGSFYKDKHTGTFGKTGVFSFNGNKTVTCGGGGALITNDFELAKKAKHLTTQAKVSHQWAFIHDEIGYNYRLPNLNAAMACAQLEQLNIFITNKRKLSNEYFNFFQKNGIKVIKEIEYAKSNYWLNFILLENIDERNAFLTYSNSNGIMTRPSWELMHKLEMFKECIKSELTNSEWISERLVNIPSSVRQ
jgi:aminotransferase in exopolysaccharide biosynthesis